jgi:DNA-binding response OmpR family regulator
MVDDEVDLVRSTVEMLRKEFDPTPVIGISDPRDAMALLDRERPSVLITDIRMPHINGLELIIYAQKKWSSVPIIAITAFPSAEVTAHSRFSGFAYLQKPVAFKTLSEVIANLSEVPMAAFRGAVATTTLADVVQLYALSNQTGVITVEFDNQSGEIWLDQGRAVHACLGNLSGTNAFYRIMNWPRGSFSWQPSRPKQVTMHGPLTELLLEAYRLKDEQAQWLQALDDGAAAPRPADSGSTEPLDPVSDLEDPLHDSWSDELDSGAAAPVHPDSELAAESPGEPALLDDVEIIWNDTDPAEPRAALMTKETEMALSSNNIKENLIKLEATEGFIGAALADSDSGMCLGFLGGAGVLNMELAAASNAEVVRSKRKAMKALGLRDEIEDILISLGKQYHLIRPLKSRPSVFFYVALDRGRSNLAMARYALADAERELAL